MKKRLWVVQVCLGLFFLMLPLKESKAGILIEQIMRDKEGKASKALFYYSENQLRTEHPESGQATILDLKEDRMVMIDHRSKGYVEVKFSQWEKETAQELRRQSPGIRVKERKISVKKLGEKAILNGFQIEKVQVFADGELIEEHWMTQDVDMSETDKMMERLFQTFSKESRQQIKEGQAIHQKLKPFGFSILIKDYSQTYGLGAVDILEVKRIERKEFKEEVFLPPSGYERIIPKPSKK